MSAHDVIEVSRRAIDEAEKNGTKTIDLNTLRELLNQIEQMLANTSISASELEQVGLEQYRAILKALEKNQEHENALKLEGFRQVINLGQAALKSIILINGGASVALLAFLGHLVSVSPRPLSSAPFSDALVFFVVGVGLASLASGTTYLSQYFYERNKPWHRRLGNTFHGVTLLFVASAYVAFFWGAIIAYNGFSSAAH